MFRQSVGQINRHEAHNRHRRTEEKTAREDLGDRQLKKETSDNYETSSVDHMDTDSLIADMAKGFVAAQGKINSANSVDNVEMLQLLTKISRQLEQFQQPGNNMQTNQNNDHTNTGNQAEQQQLSGAGTMQLDNQTRQQPQALATGQAAADSQSGNIIAAGNQAGGPVKASPAKMASQLLSQAQFELSQELEVSLQKLKQVITESENLASRISNLIDEKNNSQ